MTSETTLRSDFLWTEQFPPLCVVCSAWLPEQRVLRSLAAGKRSESADELSEVELCCRRVCLESLESAGVGAELFQQEVAFLLLGVGVFSALLKTQSVARRISRLGGCSQFHFVGTAGEALEGEFEKPRAVTVSEARWVDFDVLERNSYVPELMLPELRQVAAVPSSGMDSLEGQPCTSALGISRVERSCYTPGIDLENLEIYGLARACSESGFLWQASVGVSNKIGPKSHAEWKRFHSAASCEAQLLFIERYLSQRSQLADR